MSSKETSMSFKKFDRCYKIRPGWRLATFQEVKDNLESIKQQGLLEERDRARLLDGWINGPFYKFQMGNNFRYCMDYMLAIQVHMQANCSSGDTVEELYEGVNLTEEGKQVALLLCAYDWNYEVVYWLLNSWDKTETMDPLDVRDGSIPLKNASAVEDVIQLNNLINDLTRKLGETSIDHKASNKKLTLGLLKDVLLDTGTSCLAKLTEANKKLLGRSFQNHVAVTSQYVGKYWIQAFESHRDSAHAMWNDMWEHFSTEIVRRCTFLCFQVLINKWEEKSLQETRSRSNFILSTSILYYIHQSILGDSPLFKRQQGKHNRLERLMTIPRDENFNVLEKILHLAAGEGDVNIIKKMLDCRARALSQNQKKQTALHLAFVHITKEDKLEEVVKIVLVKCGAKEDIINAPDAEGRTVLHLAAAGGKATMCTLLLDSGAKPDAEDNRGRLPLHYAVEGKKDEAVDVLIGRKVSDQESILMLRYKDKDEKSPLDIEVGQKNIKLLTKLLLLGQPSESYFNKENSGKLLRQFAFQGNTEIVGKLLERGASPLDVDEDGKTALHHAAMCEGDFWAAETIDLILEKCQDRKKLISMRDVKGKTALHVIADKGNSFLEDKVYADLQDLVDIKDREGRNPLYDATEGKSDISDIIHVIVNMMEKKGISLDDMIDPTGLTPLHMAASQGKVFQVDVLLCRSANPKKYVKKADYKGQTALHKAAKGGHMDTIKVLLHWGAQPLLERDWEGRTVLHYAVQTKTGEDGISLVELLLKKCGSDERQSLFLWMSAGGLGTADQSLSSSPLKKFLLEKKKELTKKTNSLLKTAVSIGDTEMVKELLRRGYKIEDLFDWAWTSSLPPRERFNFRKVVEEIDMSSMQANDQPSVYDYLGRADVAKGLAALLLNPYVEPPIAIGISGSWGMGKSSVMAQTEIILLETAAQSALLPTSKSSKIPGVQELELSKKGEKKYKEIKRWVDSLENDSNLIKDFLKWIVAIKGKIQRLITKRKNEKHLGKDWDSLVWFLNYYKPGYRPIFKSLAARDRSYMFTREGQQSYSRIESEIMTVPAIITVQYNAWTYQNKSEALAGMAVEITKEMEGIMTQPQWLSTCWRNTWRKQKQTILIEVIFPYLIAFFLAGTFTWILWLLLDRYNFNQRIELKYASLPATIVIMVWTLVKSVMATINPVSTQLMSYIKFPDHTDKLGYQERVIDDIKFLKRELGKKPYALFSAATCIWHLITSCCSMISYLCPKLYGETMAYSNAAFPPSYASDCPRIIVFVDDLDRCDESVILQVLSAINLVLAVCQISVIVGMDKTQIDRAIKNKYGNKSPENSQQIADKYLQKIIQLSFDLPDPSQEEYKRFLKVMLGVHTNQIKDKDREPETDTHDDSNSDTDDDYDALFSPFERRNKFRGLGDSLKDMFIPEKTIPDPSVPDEAQVAIHVEGDSKLERDANDIAIAIDIQSSASEADTSSYGDASEGDQRSGEPIPIREMLFVRYDEGEQEAFCYFQKMATDYRKLPRQWKCLLYYHRLVWCIYFMRNEATSFFNGWEVELIAWIFICWEWQENINILIQKWHRIGILKTYKSESGSSGPTLRDIVDYHIENEYKDENMSATSDKDKAKVLEGSESKEMKSKNLKEDLKGKGISKNTEHPESSNRKLVQLEPIHKEEMTTMADTKGLKRIEEGDKPELLGHSKNERTASEKMEEGMKEKDVFNNKVDDDESSNREIEKLEEVVKDQMITGTDSESNNRAISEKLDDVVKTLRQEIEKALKELDGVKKEIRDLKKTKQQTGNNEKNEREKKMERKNWQRMKVALKRYNVSMSGIQAFQRFRFYCVAGHLPWPLPKEETEDS